MNHKIKMLSLLFLSMILFVGCRENGTNLRENTINSIQENESVSYTIKEVIEYEYAVDVNQDGKNDIVRLKMREDIDDENHLSHNNTWKGMRDFDQRMGLVNVFLDVVDGETGEIYSTPFEREQGEWTFYFVDEMHVIYPEAENTPIFFISTAFVGNGIGVQESFRLLQCNWDKTGYIWSTGYEYKTGIDATMHYLSDYMAEVIVDGEIIAQINLENVLETSYLEYIKQGKYDENGLVVREEYEITNHIETKYRFIEVSDNNITAKAVLRSGPVDIGMLVVKYYFENEELLCQYAFEEFEKEEE